TSRTNCGAAFASKPAPTGECVSNVGAGLLAKNDDAVDLKDRAVCFASKLCSCGEHVKIAAFARLTR
ncbi:hypothetical protein M4Z12_32360, partial [Pseudomonas sp. In614]|uniref:hypothetical protein n=1 Tax=Pseudomonas nunensis TaxID=2961896 RepID=UPI0020C123C9